MHSDDGGPSDDESDARSIEFVNVFRDTARGLIQVDATSRHSDQLRRRGSTEGERLVEIIVEPDVHAYVVALRLHSRVLQVSQLGVACAEGNEWFHRPE